MSARTADRSGHRREQAYLLAIVLAGYSAFAAWSLPFSADALTNAITAWHLGVLGTPFLTGTDAADLWIVEGVGGPVSQYPPGTALLAAPAYALLRPPLDIEVTAIRNPELPPYTFLAPPVWPATLMAVITSALVALFLLMTLEQLKIPPRLRIAAVLVASFGTGLFSVASNALWQHGPAALVLASGFWLMTRARFRTAALVFGLLGVVRPLALLIPAVAAVAIAVDRRSVRPLLEMSVAGWGVCALVLYNRWVFDTFALTPGYDSSGLRPPEGVEALIGNVVSGFLDPHRGLVMVSPFLVPLAIGLPRAWRASGAAIRGAALGGLVYFLVHLTLNRFTGGGGFFGYRYPIESLVAAVPLLTRSYEAIADSYIVRVMVYLGVCFAIGLQVIWSVLS